MTTPVTVVRRFYDPLGRGDVASVLSLLDDKVEWTKAERQLGDIRSDPPRFVFVERPVQVTFMAHVFS